MFYFLKFHISLIFYYYYFIPFYLYLYILDEDPFTFKFSFEDFLSFIDYFIRTEPNVFLRHYDDNDFKDDGQGE